MAIINNSLIDWLSDNKTKKSQSNLTASQMRKIADKALIKKQKDEDDKNNKIAEIRKANGKFWIETNGDQILEWIKEAAAEGRDILEFDRGKLDYPEWREITDEIGKFLTQRGFNSFYSGQTSMGYWGFWVRW